MTSFSHSSRRATNAQWRAIRFSVGLLSALGLSVGIAHAECSPFDGFVVNDDGTVTDPRSGTIWQQCDVGQSWDGKSCTGESTKADWYSAMTEAKSNRFLDRSDWRLPTYSEFKSVVGNAEQCSSRRSPCDVRAVSKNLATHPGVDKYWTSSPGLNKKPYGAEVVSFCYGIRGDGESAYRSSNKYHRYAEFFRARLVRAGNTTGEFLRELGKFEAYKKAEEAEFEQDRIAAKRSTQVSSITQQSGSRNSGDFTMYGNNPQRSSGKTQWYATCTGGSQAIVTLSDNNSSTLCWAGGNSRGDCQIGIGVEAAMRKACGG